MASLTCRFLAASLGLMALSGHARAQRTTDVRVVDDVGRAVPFAVVNVGNAAPRVADDSGRVQLGIAAKDSIEIRAKRIGFAEFYGYVKRDSSSQFVVRMNVAVQRLATMTVTERANTVLSRTRFYERVDRVQRGANVGEFITPEELELRDPSQISGILQGRRSVRLSYTQVPGGRRQPVILGRAGCGMNIVVDGQLASGTVQDDMSAAGPTTMRGTGNSNANSNAYVPKSDIDDLVSGRSVMAVEIYPSVANAPADVVPVGARGSCGLVVIWTGPRQ